MDWSEDERRAALRPGDQSESEGKRPGRVPNPQRDNAKPGEHFRFPRLRTEIEHDLLMKEG